LVAVTRRALPILASLFGVCLIALFIYGITHQAASRSLDEQLASGLHPVAPDATRMMPILGGSGDSSLGKLRGKVVVLNLWASWCPPCQAEAPLLERNQGALERDGATVLGVTYEDAAPDSQRFVARYHLTYPNLRDSVGAFAHSYGTDQLPESFLVNRQGRIVAIERGEIEQPFINRAIALAKSS
jgi:cytochrome c biogenesis protein CcmG, thiol:disulfide interchange protein DsbE